MDANRFDALAKTVTTRLTRRTALRGIGGGVAATSLASLGVGRSTAQDGTPAATPDPTSDGDRASFLFVQTAQSGTWLPKAGEDGVYTLTLRAPAEQTVYFSDRPERIAGTVPMQRFLDGLGFSPTDPPNAALVTQTEAGEDVLVIELIAPVYDPDTGTLTYDAQVLENYQEDGLAFLADRQGDMTMPEQFGSASLFIDDCGGGDPLQCYTSCGGEPVGDLGNRDMCVSISPKYDFVGCVPCVGGFAGTAVECNQAFSACNGQCDTWPTGCEPPAPG